MLVRRILVAQRISPRRILTHSAVAELMSAAKKPKPTAEDVEPTSTLEKAKNAVKGWDPRNGLGVYLEKPETNPEGRVVEYDDDFVVIRDKFPKARYVTVENRGW
jgi:aprataxin